MLLPFKMSVFVFSWQLLGEENKGDHPNLNEGKNVSSSLFKWFPVELKGNLIIENSVVKHSDKENKMFALTIDEQESSLKSYMQY